MKPIEIVYGDIFMCLYHTVGGHRWMMATIRRQYKRGIQVAIRYY